MPQVVVVTESCASLPENLLERLRIYSVAEFFPVLAAQPGPGNSRGMQWPLF